MFNTVFSRMENDLSLLNYCIYRYSLYSDLALNFYFLLMVFLFHIIIFDKTVQHSPEMHKRIFS